MNFETKLEFGDFESSVNFEASDECVELPPSWLIEDVNEFELSFSVPSQCNGITIPNKNEIEFGDFEEVIEMPPTEDLIPVKATKPASDKHNDADQQNNNECDDAGALSSQVDTEASINVDSDSSKINGAASKQSQTQDTLQIIVDNKPNDDINEQKISNAVEETAVKRTLAEDETASVSLNTEFPEEKLQPIPNDKPGSSWAGLFKSSGKKNEVGAVSNMVKLNSSHAANKAVQNSDNTTSKSKPIESTVTNGLPEPSVDEVKNSANDSTTVKPQIDKHAELLAKLLFKLDLKFKPQAFIPRGLINSSNWCYINATLQALLMCPPFYQLLKSLPAHDNIKNYSESMSPTIDCFVKLASEFHPLSTKKGYQTGKDMRQGQPFAPECVYDMLSATKSTLSDSGRQEDAEEFLSCALNGLHEEMVKLFQLSSDEHNEILRESDTSNNENYSPPEKTSNDSDGEEWEEVITTKRNRSAVTRRADTSKTPISKIFRGELCTSVFRPGQKLSISHEPFYCLPLTVANESERFWSVEDAMFALTNKENFLGNNNDQTASRQQAVEILPPILILHLKRFVYDKSGGSKKLDRKVDFKSDLIIPKDIMSKTSKKYSHSQRTYKLFAVVCHHGERATGGHYSADVFHIGMSSWLRIDKYLVN